MSLLVLFIQLTLAQLLSEPETLPPPVVCAEWYDAKGDLGWKTKEQYDPVVQVFTCGILVSEDDAYLVLALDWSTGDANYNSMGSIPRGMIKRQWEMQAK